MLNRKKSEPDDSGLFPGEPLSKNDHMPTIPVSKLCAPESLLGADEIKTVRRIDAEVGRVKGEIATLATTAELTRRKREWHEAVERGDKPKFRTERELKEAFDWDIRALKGKRNTAFAEVLPTLVKLVRAAAVEYSKACREQTEVEQTAFAKFGIEWSPALASTVVQCLDSTGRRLVGILDEEIQHPSGNGGLTPIEWLNSVGIDLSC